mgnify:CR=1 FL=1
MAWVMTSATLAYFFTNFGVAYTCRLVDVPASTGYGEPIQSLFKFRDGERVDWQGLPIEVLDTPGYTRGAVSYLFEIDGRRIAWTSQADDVKGDIWVMDVDGGHALRRGPNFTQFVEPAIGHDALSGGMPK